MCNTGRRRLPTGFAVGHELADGHVFGWATACHQRYAQATTPPEGPAFWRFDTPVPTIRAGRSLRIIVQAPARVRYSLDNWKTCEDVQTDSRGGLEMVDLPTHQLLEGARVVFTFFWTQSSSWEGRDFTVQVQG